MGDSLGSSARVSSQKQNHESVVGAQSGQYRATMESSQGCGGGPSRDVTRAVRLWWVKWVLDLGGLGFEKESEEGG